MWIHLHKVVHKTAQDVARLVQFLKLDGSQPEVRKVVEQYRPGANDSQQGLHFYKGRIGRFRESYGAYEQKVMVEKFGSALAKMGYPV